MSSRTTLRLTRMGKAGVLVSVAILLGALNTANNLLYLLSAVLFALYPVSAVLASRQLKGLARVLHVPDEVMAGGCADLALRLSAGRGSAAGLLAEVRGKEGQVGQAGLSWLDASDSASVRLALPVRKRGALPVTLQVSSCFPFGLLTASQLEREGELLVLPRPSPDWRRPEGLGVGDGHPSQVKKGRGHELLEVRDYRDGDDARDMHWKVTARLARPMVRENAVDLTRRVTLVVEPHLRPSGGGEEAVERVISLAAGAAEGLEKEGWQLRLLTPDQDVKGGAREVLRALARQASTTEPPTRDQVRRTTGEDPVLVFSTEGAA